MKIHRPRNGATLWWRHNERDGVSIHQARDCLLNCLFKAQIKETSKPASLDFVRGIHRSTGEFPAQRASNAENVSILWRHHVLSKTENTPRRQWPAMYALGMKFLMNDSSGSKLVLHYSDVIMDTIASQITSLTIVYSIIYSCADQRKHQSSASLAFVRGIHRSTVKSPHKGPVTRKLFPFDDVIMI